MNAKERIRTELFMIMSAGEATLCAVWKGWGSPGPYYGWWFTPFTPIEQASIYGATFLGKTIDDAIQCIRGIHDEKKAT